MQKNQGFTKEEIERVQFEEYLRTKIRTVLTDECTVKKQGGWKDFVNSNFGLWLLSLFFVSGLGASITWYQNHLKEQQQIEETKWTEARKKKERIDRLSMEFSYRFSSALINLENVSNLMGKSMLTNKRSKLLSDALSPLSLPTTADYSPLFPEFKTYSGLALIAELRTITEPGEQKILKDKITKLSAIINDSPKDIALTPDKVKKLAGNLVEEIKYPRLDNGFKYLDCKKTNPFC